MKYTSSTEIFKPAAERGREIDRIFEIKFGEALAASVLSDREGVLCYVPIVMPAEMRSRYPARSKVRNKLGNIIDIAPQLDYDCFVGGDLSEGIVCYIDGIISGIDLFLRTGFSKADVSVIRNLIESVKRDMLVHVSSAPSLPC